ncbi:VMAP-C domain-containing protein [Streptomyces katsurahamanus]|uniref:Trypsin-like peptidase domain-containing protein n=1 Tax=Streptomyces katsurahamanus TaxID=2577098 RepID=A0ABW9NRF7_9ACTN|nr:trypsin-like peptidase domain-containing protein [Streptomyces katsurahamanus]MQS35744.1 trypsin-like peptidase domain-containing protein [Streptomyces katsurahamanus]
MTDSDSVIDALTRAAVVHFASARPEEPAMWGTGFFVAPGWVLTCAHVLAPHLRGDPGRVFQLSGSEVNGGEPLDARLDHWLLDGEQAAQSVPVESDLALVRVLDSGVEHECVWLTDRTDHPGGRGVVQGYRPRADRRAVRWKATARINGFDDDYGMRFVPEAEFPKGGSGSPVLDVHTGSVVGVLKSRRAGRDGGMAIAATALRRFGPVYQRLMAAHDRWHGQSPKITGHNWIERQHQLPGAGVHTGGDQWSPRDRREALALLGSVPPPDGIRPVAELAKKARGSVAAPPGQLPPHAWRDGHGLLYEAGRPVAAIAALHYLQLVVEYERDRGGDPAALADWVAHRLQDVSRIVHTVVTQASLPPGIGRPAGPPGLSRLGVRYPRLGDGSAIVIVELEPVADAVAPRFYWRVRVDDGHDLNEPLHEEQHGDGVPPERLVRRLRGPLAEVFASVDSPGTPAPLEVALPADHFDTAVHRWQLTEMARLHHPAYVGVRRMVVLRDITRRGEPDAVWVRRWREMERSGALTAVRTPPPRQVPRARHFEEMGPSAVPVLCRPAGSGVGRRAMRMALDAGYGVALWHTDGHPDHGCTDFCERLHDGAARFLEQAADPLELPDRLRRIRDDISGSRNGGHWAEGVALLYDDPDRPLPGDGGGPVDSP